MVNVPKFHSLDIIFINISYPYFLGCDWRTDVCPRSSNSIGPESGGVHTCDLTRSYNFVQFLSNDYTNPKTNPKTLTASILTLTYPDDAFESFCALAFCDFIRNYSRIGRRLSASHFVFGYLLISSSFTRMLTYSKLKYIINYCSFIDV